jgi:hypothetical protein
MELKSRSAAGRHEMDIRTWWRGGIGMGVDGSGWMERRPAGTDGRGVPGRRAGRRLSWRPRARAFCPVSPCARPAPTTWSRARTRLPPLPQVDAALPARAGTRLSGCPVSCAAIRREASSPLCASASLLASALSKTAACQGVCRLSLTCGTIIISDALPHVGVACKETLGTCAAEAQRARLLAGPRSPVGFSGVARVYVATVR